jgi:hypothetical protein
MKLKKSTKHFQCLVLVDILETHHCTDKRRIRCRAIKYNSRSPETGKNNDIKSEPFTAVDGLNFKDARADGRTEENRNLYILNTLEIH